MTASSSLQSNALNFMSHVDTGTDPRTGLYTCSINLPVLKSNNLCGPDVKVQLSFSPLNDNDSGLGLGWNLQLSQYNTYDHILSLGTGETFKVTGSGPEPAIAEKKLASFHFFNDGDGLYRVVHKSGLVEILSICNEEGTVCGVDRIALPRHLLSAQGHRVDLTYIKYGNGRLLSSIENADGTQLLSLVRDTDSVSLLLHPDSADEALYRMQLNDGWVTRIELPTDNKASWRFKYKLQPDGALRIIEVQTPLGGLETLTYSEIPHYFPGDDGRTLARVATHRNDPGNDEAVILTHYSYSKDHHNFLGFGSSVVWRNDGMDNLYRAGEGYTYSTIQSLGGTSSDNAIRHTTRTFNRFHLLIVEETVQNDNVLRNETAYHLFPGTDFERQPPYCQLPKTTSQTWYSQKNPAHKRTDTVTTTYDNFGNLLTRINANDVTETSTWYKAEGEDGCPPDPQKFVRNLKDKTITPAPSDYGQAPTLRTRYTYSEQLGLPGNKNWLAIGEETLVQVIDATEQELQRTAFTYICAPDKPFEHGRKLQEAVTLNGKTTTTHYAYSKTHNERSAEDVQHTLSTLIGFDDRRGKIVRKEVTLQHSLSSGRALLSRDGDNMEIAYKYDRLGRLMEEIVAAGSPNEATRRYTYRLSRAKGQRAEQSVTDVKGVQTLISLDGLGRVVLEELIGSDPTDPTRVVRTYSARYNGLGQLSLDTVYDWWELDGQLAERSLTTFYFYDDWVQLRSVRGTDGIARITENDPIKLEQRSWLESIDNPPRIAGMSVTTSNLFEKPVKIQHLDSQQKTVSEREFFYDGLGHCIEQYDEVGELTRFEYDPWSRLSTTTLPDSTQVIQTYAEHSNASLPIHLQVISNNSAEDPVVAGERVFDGLNRVETLHVGPRTLRYEYLDGEMQAHKLITAKGKEIRFEYQFGLTAHPVGVVAEDEQSSFTYDSDSAQLLISENSQGRYEFDYDVTGRLLGECWIEGGKTWETRYTSTPRGRQVTRTDMNRLTTTYTYDEHGRLETVCQGQLHSRFQYNSLGQLHSTCSQDLDAGSTLLTEQEYDERGRETQRTLSLTGHPVQTLRMTYRADSKLATRHLLEGNRSLLLETFAYDPRGRLEVYTCSGDSRPKDRYGNAIVQELFAFDALDNITQVWRNFEDLTMDEATSEFALSDPCQLVKVTHTHDDYLAEFPRGIELSYDEDGHLQRDEQGRSLSYDTQGRLLEVSGDSLSRYRYDGHDQLLGVKHGEDTETLRFYQDDRLSSTQQGAVHINYLRGNEQLLGQQTVGDSSQTLLFLTDTKNSVIGESQADTLRTAVFDAYGERYDSQPMRSLLSFNGEAREKAHGWYLLGKGYRAYNPHLRRFHSPDSFSPFGAGGVNPYVYGVSDPINHIDPTGHAPLQQYIDPIAPPSAGLMDWLGVLIGTVFTIASVGTLGPAMAAIAAGASAASAAVGLLTITSFVAGAASTLTGVAALVSRDEGMGEASGILGYIALGSGLGGSVVGRMAGKAAADGAYSPVSVPRGLNRVSFASANADEIAPVDEMIVFSAKGYSNSALSKTSSPLQPGGTGKTFSSGLKPPSPVKPVGVARPPNTSQSSSRVAAQTDPGPSTNPTIEELRLGGSQIDDKSRASHPGFSGGKKPYVGLHATDTQENIANVRSTTHER